jgi:3-hydroxyisobutyrate dehydrogenase-like beta-hydroxyacid dehydrogenase
MTTIAVVAAGAMGAAVGRRLVQGGCTVLTSLTGRSDATRRRAEAAGMKDATYTEIAQQAGVLLSILPPSEAHSFAEAFLSETASLERTNGMIFADCNAVNPASMKSIADLFLPSPFGVVDASIIGGPPIEGYDPTFYVSAKDVDALTQFESLSRFGLKITPLRGEGSGVGDASALKMSYAVRGSFRETVLCAQRVYNSGHYERDNRVIH